MAKWRSQPRLFALARLPGPPPRPFELVMASAGIPTPQLEFQFALPRRWAFDYAWPAGLVALEIEGGTWTHGRHTRGPGFEADCRKYNRAACLGWLVVRVTPSMVRRGTALRELRAALSARGLE